MEVNMETTQSGGVLDARYQWNVYEKIAHGDSFVWKEFKIQNATKINQLYLRQNALHPGNFYKVTVIGMALGRRNGYSENVYTVNIPPRHGRCSVDNPRGLSDETVFNFMCEGWMDTDLPLSYEFQYRTRYGVVFLLHHGILPVFSTSLPVGDVETNFVLDFQVKIIDSHGTYNTTGIDVQVQYVPKNEKVRRHLYFEEVQAILPDYFKRTLGNSSEGQVVGDYSQSECDDLGRRLF